MLDIASNHHMGGCGFLWVLFFLCFVLLLLLLLFSSSGCHTDCFAHNLFLSTVWLTARPFIRLCEWDLDKTGGQNLNHQEIISSCRNSRLHHWRHNTDHDQDHESLWIIIFHPFFSSLKCELFCAFLVILFSVYPIGGTTSILQQTEDTSDKKNSLTVLTTAVPLKLMARSLFWS